jgi:hypothetical protein
LILVKRARAAMGVVCCTDFALPCVRHFAPRPPAGARVIISCAVSRCACDERAADALHCLRVDAKTSSDPRKLGTFLLSKQENRLRGCLGPLAAN